MKPHADQSMTPAETWLSMTAPSGANVSILHARRGRYSLLGATFIVDAILIIACLFLANALWFRFDVPANNFQLYRDFFAMYVVAKVASLFVFGLYNRSAFETRSLAALSVIEACVVGAIVELGVATTLILYSGSDVYRFSRPALLIKTLLEIVAIGGARVAAIEVARRLRLLQHRTLVVGASSREAGSLLSRAADQPGRLIVGYLDARPLAEAPASGAPWLGVPDEIARLVAQNRIDEVLVLGDVVLRDRVLGRLLSHTVSIKVLPHGLESVVSKRQTHEIDDVPLLEINATALSLTTMAGKRALDVAISGTGLLMAAPLFAFLWVMYRLFHGGDMIFTQERIGRDGRLFTVYKVRTMVKNAESVTGAVKCHGRDPRVFGLGWVLRRTHLDELPQLWNVFLGDMSFVGPRPERPELAAKYLAENPAYNLRHIVRPGLTGLAQIKGSYDTAYDYKLFYDLMYAFNVSLLLDLQIIYCTPKYIIAELFGEKNQY